LISAVKPTLSSGTLKLTGGVSSEKTEAVESSQVFSSISWKHYGSSIWRCLE
jgi:hypothetical protein